MLKTGLTSFLVLSFFGFSARFANAFEVGKPISGYDTIVTNMSSLVGTWIEYSCKSSGAGAKTLRIEMKEHVFPDKNNEMVLAPLYTIYLANQEVGSILPLKAGVSRSTFVSDSNEWGCTKGSSYVEVGSGSIKEFSRSTQYLGCIFPRPDQSQSREISLKKKGDLVSAILKYDGEIYTECLYSAQE